MKICCWSKKDADYITNDTEFFFNDSDKDDSGYSDEENSNKRSNFG